MNGTTARLATAEDAEAYLALQHRIDRQTAFMLLEPGERPEDPAALRARLLEQDGTGSFDLVAVETPSTGAESLIGWLSVEVLPFARARHSGYLVIGVDAAAGGRGTGRALLAAAAAEARRRGLSRLELTVLVENERARRLYDRCGYAVEGLRRGSVRRDGRLLDEEHRALLL